MVGRIRFALERFASPRHRSHVAQLFSLGHIRAMSDTLHPLYRILAQLEAAKIHFTLARVRDETVMIEAHVPGRHYEIEVFADGKIEVEVYKSHDEIGGQELVDELLRDFSD